VPIDRAGVDRLRPVAGGALRSALAFLTFGLAPVGFFLAIFEPRECDNVNAELTLA
jgi:hypothetical protein